MRLFLILLLALSLSAQAATPSQPHLLGLSLTADGQATSLEIDLSARAPLSTIVKPDRIEIDLPTTQWDRTLRWLLAARFPQRQWLMRVITLTLTSSRP